MFITAFAQDAGTQIVQEAAQPLQQTVRAAQQNPLITYLPILLMIVAFYFLLIRPQQKAQQEHAKMLQQLKKNDEVVTSGGIFGTIVNIQNDIVTLRVDDDAKIRVQKNYIAALKK